jgi:ParB family transcriptional regulator, chromosome partitioning protein
MNKVWGGVSPRGLREKELGIGGICAKPERLRALRPEVVAELAKSMNEVGLLHPIVVQPRGLVGNGFWIIAGRHRFEAAKKLRWEAIRCTILDGIDADRAALAEIDENLVRANLSDAEEAAHHAERKRLYEKLHPETKIGVNQHTGRVRQNGEPSKRYTEEIAKKLGRSERSVQRVVKRGTDIPNVAALAGTSLDRGVELDALAKLSREEQHPIIERAKAGETVSVKQHAIAAEQSTPLERILSLLPELTLSERQQLGLVALVESMDAKERERFISELNEAAGVALLNKATES